MLTCQVLNSDASLNNFFVIGSLPFIPGAEIVLVIRLIQAQRADSLRYTPPNTATLNLRLPKTDGTTEVLSMTALTDDRSIWSATLTENLTSLLTGGNFTFELDLLGDGTKIWKGWLENGLQRLITGE